MEYINSEFSRLQTSFDVIGLVGLFFIALIVTETIWDWIKKYRTSAGETIANFVIGIVNELLGRTLFGFVFVLGLFIVGGFAPFSIPETWWSWVLAVFAADLSYYWMHRIEHESRFFWAYHSVHHSSPEYNLTTSLRLSWVEGIFEWVFFVPMILIGFSPIQTLVALIIIVQYQTWIHTEKIGRMAWLDKVFNTPSVHRVHHGANKQYIDKNYGGLLIIWDRLFGTYQREEEKVIYGLTKSINTTNPIKINAHEYLGIIKDIIQLIAIRGIFAKGIVADCFGLAFKRPGWKPSALSSGSQPRSDKG